MMRFIQSLPFVLLIGLLSVGCNQDKVEQLEREKAQLRADKKRQDSILNDFMSTFNEFEDNLAMIKEKESLITMGDENPEYRSQGKERVIQDIQMINDLLDQNRQIIDELTAKAERAEGLSSQYRRTIGSLKRQLEERDQEITELKDQLVALDYRIEDLNTRIDTLSRTNQNLAQTTQTQRSRIERQRDSLRNLDQTVSQQDQALNTAYYVSGSKRELKGLAVIERDGLFGSQELAKDFDPSAFNRIDIREMTEIPIDSRKPELLTVHPAGTYEFQDTNDDKDYDVLRITNPREFWKTSRYCVIRTR